MPPPDPTGGERRPRVSLTLPQFHREASAALEAVDAAGQLGYHGVFCFDHLVPLDDPHRPVLEAASLLGTMAARSRVRVGTLVLRAPMRGPAVSAAIAHTAAAVSRHGLVLGLGAGDSLSAEETRRYGQPSRPLDERVQAVADTIDAVRSQSPETAVWIGGRHRKMLDVAVRQADGWNGWGMDPAEFAQTADELRSRRPDLTLTWGGGVVVGRDRRDLERLLARRGGDRGVTAGTPHEVAAHLRQWVEAGADELVVSVLPNRPERWELLSREVLPSLPGR